MERGNTYPSSEAKSPEPEKATRDKNENEETMEEDIEYEEVEEEEEDIDEDVEEDDDPVEDREEDEEEDEDEEVEADEDPDRSNETDSKTIGGGDSKLEEDEDEKKKHVELLSLPSHGSEIYVGGIPHDASSEDLKALCESVGEVTDVRIMKGKNSAENKGFGFVTFKTVELASKAIDELNNKEFKGKMIKCSTSQEKNRLFIGNIPRSLGEEDLKNVLTEIGPGVTTVELVKDMKNTNINRGFAFIDYYNHACADHSRRKMITKKVKIGDNFPTVSWADPKNVDSSAASQVKAVYVKNLPKDVSQDQLKKIFEHHGKISKVIIPAAKHGPEKNAIGFVHFAERASAMKALQNTEKYELNGQVLECSLAKPQADQKPGRSNSKNPGLLLNYPPHGGLGTGRALPQSVYKTGAVAAPPAGVAMIPMLLPDGRMAYVVQQPGAGAAAAYAPQQGGRNSGSSSRPRLNNSTGRRYRPY